MNKILIIGSTALDIILEVDRLPSTAQDCHINHQSMAIGGCAYNVQNIIQHFNVPHLFCTPVGTGIYGEYVEKQLLSKDVTSYIKVSNQDNGCCYCYVEPHGERTFLSYHGAEYTFSKEWLDAVPIEEYNKVYVCGLEVEEPTGDAIIEYLEEHLHLEVFFAPGPRINSIGQSKINRIFKRSPVLHLNRDEITAYTGKADLYEAAKALFLHTKNTILITDGGDGSYMYDGSSFIHIDPIPTQVVDTIGAGDAHIGAVIACRQRGYSFEKSLRIANAISSVVVGSKGGTLSTNEFDSLNIL